MMGGRFTSLKTVILVLLVSATMTLLAACGGEEPTATASPTEAPHPAATAVPASSTPTPAPAPTEEPAAMEEPTAVPVTAAPPTAVPPTPEPTTATAAQEQPTEAPATATPEPQPTAPPEPAEPTEQELLAAYAAEHANGPGAIFVGDPSHLIGPPPHDGLMFGMPAEQYNFLAGAGLAGAPELQIPGHMFIYSSDYYQGLIRKARLTSPTELVSSGENIEIQHVCLDRNLPPCVLVQTYLVPNIAARTNGQVKISVISLAELSIDGTDTLNLVANGTLNMVNIFTGYVAGQLPALEVQSLWGSAPDWETSYTTLTLMADDIDRIVLEATWGSPVLNRNWFAGTDQWFYSKTPLVTQQDFEGLKIRSNSSSMSEFISGMGGQPTFTSIAELYTSFTQGIVDSAVYGALLAVSARLYEISDYMAGPIIGFGYTNNVINKDVWNDIPEDLQQIMIEEGAKAELEGLRLAPFQNVAAVAINQSLGVQPVPFSPEVQQHIQTVVLPEHVLPGWVRRLGFPERNADIVAIYNENVSPFNGFRINDDGTIGQVEITKGPRASQ